MRVVFPNLLPCLPSLATGLVPDGQHYDEGSDQDSHLTVQSPSQAHERLGGSPPNPLHVLLISEANLWLFTVLQRQHGHCGAGVADEVVVVLEQRSRVPASAFALIGLQPCHAIAHDGV